MRACPGGQNWLGQESVEPQPVVFSILRNTCVFVAHVRTSRGPGMTTRVCRAAPRRRKKRKARAAVCGFARRWLLSPA